MNTASGQALRRGIARRVAAWARQRQGIDALPLTLTARRLYIVPTRTGLGLATLLVAMLLAGLNYQNGLALLLCFTLTGVMLVAMVRCHQRLQGLRIDTLHLQPAFCGQTVQVTARLHLPADECAEDLQARLRDEPTTQTRLHALDGRFAQLSLSGTATQRGWWVLPAIQLQTTAPFGLFRSWTWIHLPLHTIVYPAPSGSLPLPSSHSGSVGDSTTLSSGSDEWLGLREHREADGLRQVDWKRWARGGSMQVRQFAGLGGGTRELDFASVSLPDLEARLSQLTLWLMQLDAMGETYLLRLPTQQIQAGQGPQQLQRCLAALGTYGQPSVPVSP